ncbi:hypothetical protein [Candidatus Leptofilum sp.]|uniref:hypothetical protein n=1 Tax=Candidatus Leptofilum sp. TaxID=3241576 RepID=UPI003B5AAB8D
MKRKYLLIPLGIIGFLLLVLTLIFPAILMWQQAPPLSSVQVIRQNGSVPTLELVSVPEDCETTAVANEPPCNPSLARSGWSISHGGSYAQGSTALPGPTANDTFLVQHLDLANVAITYNFSSPYADGGVAVWGSLLTLDGTIVKLDHDAFAVIDSYSPQFEENGEIDRGLGISGAYSAIDRDNHFIVGRQRAVEIYADSVAGDRYSAIALLKRFQLPDEFFCGDADLIVGINLTYDDHIVIVTEGGVVGVLPREIEKLTAVNLQRYSINGDNCQNENDHIISNSIAVDEEGGIYIVTSRAMLRVQWDGSALSLAWQTPYDTAPGYLSALRLGPGSGSTPSLMGTGTDADKFVVFTDGQELMHLVFMWRDEIPSDWQPIAPGKDRRIACEVPIRFGYPEATRSLSEQSVLVRGYAAVVVNNLLQEEPGYWRRIPQQISGSLAAFAGGDPDVAPFGIERIDWDATTQQCQQVWVNEDISIPNGIPTMSEASGLFYGIGQRDGVWGLEAVDFATGESAFFVPSSQTTCSLASVPQIRSLGLRFTAVIPTLLTRPRNCENTVFAATEVGPDSTIYTGTFLGVSKFSP